MNRTLVIIALLSVSSSMLAMHRVQYPENLIATPDSNMHDLSPVIAALGIHETQPQATTSDSDSRSSSTESDANSNPEGYYDLTEESWRKSLPYVE